MRGKAEVRHERDQEPGITPACAGKRHCPRFRPGKTRDHPRVCGEKRSAARAVQAAAGSPPRVRGKAFANTAHMRAMGITPACAGKRMVSFALDRSMKDHPRVCGEKPVELEKVWEGKGSPPRVRGKVKCAPQLVAWDRITPACAGKSPLRT